MFLILEVYLDIYNMAELVQKMAWRRTGDKPLSETMLVCFTDSMSKHPSLQPMFCLYKELLCIACVTEAFATTLTSMLCNIF